MFRAVCALALFLVTLTFSGCNGMTIGVDIQGNWEVAPRYGYLPVTCVTNNTLLPMTACVRETGYVINVAPCCSETIWVAEISHLGYVTIEVTTWQNGFPVSSYSQVFLVPHRHPRFVPRWPIGHRWPHRGTHHR